VTSFVGLLNRLGPARFAAVLILLPLSVCLFAAGIYAALDLDLVHVIPEHRSHRDDFVTFWAAAHLALSGVPEQAYDQTVLAELERAITGPATKFTPWHYPPTFLLAVLPLGLLPYSSALVLWLLVPFTALLALVRRLSHGFNYSWLLLLFPGSVICMVSGQNGFLTAFLIGCGLFRLGERPVIAGIAFGLLTWKPHLALLVFVALAAGRCWIALASACATAVVLALMSLVAFGLAPWQAFFGNLTYVTNILDTGGMPWHRMPSVYVSARLLGMDIQAARILQIAAALAALAAVCAIWRRGAPLVWRSAAVMAALPLVTPYVFDYDLVVLAFVVMWLVDACLKDGWRPGDTLVLVAVWIGPALSWPLVKHGGPPFMPVVFALLLAAIWRRAFPAAALSAVPQARPV
jgi:hypothetical protein